MRTTPERTHTDFLEAVHDPLRRYRSVAQKALDDPDWNVADSHFEASDGFNAEIAEAFATVARWLAGLDAGERRFAIDRDTALNFLTSPEPFVDTDEGQVVRIHRGDDGRVQAVTVTRSDTAPVTSTDMRFPFRVVKDFDAEHRLSSAWVDDFNLEHSDNPGVRSRAEGRRQRHAGMKDENRYQQVAALYLEAKEAGFSSTRHLIEAELEVTNNYAGVLISRARAKGYLPPIEGKATHET